LPVKGGAPQIAELRCKGLMTLPEWKKAVLQNGVEKVVLQKEQWKRGIFLAVSLANQSNWICTKQTKFTDAIYMRYGWKVKGIPTYCACG